MANQRLKPFVLFIEGVYFDLPIAIIAGVELGQDEDEAFHKATCRFPPSQYSLLPPLAWEEVPIGMRLCAIEIDRMGLLV